MSLGERPRGSARPTPNEHYNSLLRTSIEDALGHLERLAGSLPEAHTVRLLAEEAVGSARDRGAGYAGSAASRHRLEAAHAAAQAALVEARRVSWMRDGSSSEEVSCPNVLYSVRYNH